MNKKICIAILFVVSMILTGCGINEKRVEILRDENIKLGDEIIVALDEFFSVYNNYPMELEELVPDFIGALPNNEGKVKFFYLQSYDNDNNKEVYELVFHISSKDFGCSYYSGFAFWECSTIGINHE